MRHRNAGEFRRGNRGADAGDHLEWNTRDGQRKRLLGTTAEHKRVPTLEPNDTLACARGANHQPMNRLLPNAFPSRTFSNAKALTVGESAQRSCIHERVIEDEIGVFQIRNGSLRPEVWMAGPCADEGDLRHGACGGFRVQDWRSSLVQPI